MANFKGGFAFNNEAAKVEVEQAPDGTLVSCVNPVTGESLGGGENYSKTYEGTAAEIIYEDAEDLVELFNAGDVSISFTFDASAIGFSLPITLNVNQAIAPSLYANNIVNNSGLNGISYLAVFNAGHYVRVDEFIMVTNGEVTDGTSYASSIPAVMTVNFHPMPE